MSCALLAWRFHRQIEAHVWYRRVSLAMQNLYCRTHVVVRVTQHTLSADARMPIECMLCVV